MLLLISGRPAWADINNGPGGYSGGSAGDGGGTVVVVVPGSSSPGWPGKSYKGGGSDHATITCAYFLVAASVGAVLPSVGAEVTDTSTLAPGTPIWLICRDTASGDITFENIYLWNPAAPPTLTPPAVVLAQMAVNTIRLPTPGVQTWPASGSTGLVNLPVWLHVNNWRPIAASASAGGLTATVTATPVRVQWDMDVSSLACANAGSIYDPAVRPDPSSSTCSFTYRQSSGIEPDDTFHDSAVIVWHLAWTATDGEGGDLGQLNGPATGFALQIQESQALVVPSS
jgi:hypothetical protein